MEEGGERHPDKGTPQGGVISPMLANIYLHEVLDVWVEEEVKPRLRGRMHLIRYADDAVMMFSTEEDARRVMAVLSKRFEKYGLSLHPEKTRLVEFRRPRDGGPRPGTFDLLGFTHYWGRSRKGKWVVKRRTSAKRFSRALRRVSEWCRRHRHLPVSEQHAVLVRKLRGHYGYYGITGNAEALGRFLHEVEAIWQKWLSRRSQRGKILWERFKAILRNLPLLPPMVVHSVYRAAKP
jgi:hypothetical protein